MNDYQIGVIPGDGTGHEVIAEGLKVLKAASEKTAVTFEFTHYDFGGERYLQTGEILPDSAIKEFSQLDAIYLGAIGHPDVKPGILEKGILLNLRFSLDLYINLRPVKLYPGVKTPLLDKSPEHIDFDVVREKGIILILNTKKQINLKPKNLFIKDDSLYMQLGSETIKFAEQGLMKIADLLEDENDQFYIRYNHRRYKIPMRQDSSASSPLKNTISKKARNSTGCD